MSILEMSTCLLCIGGIEFNVFVWLTFIVGWEKIVIFIIKEVI